MNIRTVVKTVEIDAYVEGDAELVRIEVIELASNRFTARAYVQRDVDVTFTHPFSDDPSSIAMWVHFPIDVAEDTQDAAIKAAIAAIINR